MGEPATENASIALYQYMCQYIVGTEEHVKRMRMMNTIRDNLSSNDNTLIITSGSFGEGIEMRGSDLDIMIIWTLMEVCENKNNNFNPDTVYFAMETNDTQPGFTHYYMLTFTNITFLVLLPRYINEHNVTFPISNSDVELDNAKDGDLKHTIRFDISDNKSVYEQDRRFPFCQRSFHRYIGEDVIMKCIWPEEHVQVIDYEIKWTFNVNVILNSDRRKITSTRGNYNVETLSIFLIDKKGLWQIRKLGL
ncbi:unnamed protein product [Mytilus edulis]|uniref:Uncharacterized protein n=1 Tax=Mytilus edulis TaxID=6550 RepID=A0A8S3VDN2_MYTED|nr:unnamed protein product [Mytilus edulis]